MSTHASAEWLDDAVRKNGVTRIVKKAVAALKDIDFDTIVFRGMSGALIAPIVAHVLGKEIVMLRKPEAQTHSSYKYEGYLNVQRYIIIDDFVSTGSTVGEIVSRMRDMVADVKFVGLYIYYGTHGEAAGWYPSVSEHPLFGKVLRYSEGGL